MFWIIMIVLTALNAGETVDSLNAYTAHDDVETGLLVAPLVPDHRTSSVIEALA